jgi:phenylpyruvate tautomerase PptA (4-oxalocrotonate tautomerase family)
MPIVDVTIVVGRGETVAADLAQSLANAVGRALASSPAQTWVRLHLLAQDQYAENDAALSPSELPVFAVVLSRQVPEHSQLIAAIAALTQSISEATGRATQRVHVEYAPGARGRASFGGQHIE